MEEATARALLETMVASDAEPSLTEGEVDRLVDLARRADTYGLAPSDDGWSETWDLRYAAAEGWRWKAGKVAGAYSFGSDSQSFQRQQMHAMCLAMAKMYASGLGSVSLAGYESWTDIAENVNIG